MNDDSPLDHIETAARFARHLQVLEAVKKIHSSLDLDGILEEFLQISIKELETEGGTVYLLDPARQVLESRRIVSKVPIGRIEIPVGEGIAGKAAQTGQPVISGDTRLHEAFSGRIDRQTGAITVSTACYPLKDEKGKVIGVLQLLNKRRGSFTEEDMALLDDLSVFVALAIRNATFLQDSLAKARMDREFRLARDIQNKTLPAARPSIPGYELADFFQSCYETAGDFYHYFNGPGGDIIVIVDVSGKGVGSAMVANSIHTFLTLMLPREEDLPGLVAGLSEFLWKTYECEKYATGIFLKIRPDGRMAFVNAGHTPLIRASASGTELLNSTGPPIGMLPGAAFKEEALTLEPGALLALYTDGYNETQNADEDEFGVPRLQEYFGSARALPLRDIMAGINARLAEFQGSAKDYDDKTMICLRRLS